jgi:hypothetical protein
VRCALVLFLAAVCAGGQTDSDEALERLRKIVLDQAKRIPNYTCVQTIDRQFYVSAPVSPRIPLPKFWTCGESADFGRKIPLRLIPGNADRFRLDVRVGEGAEMYSWVGANHFGDRPLYELMGLGPSATGAFGPVLVDLVEIAPEFKFRMETTLAGRRVYDYGFHVPIERSHHYFVARDGSQVTIAYEGSIFADPETGAPVRLNVRAEDLPAETECCSYATTIDYRPVRIGDGEFLVPKAAYQRFAMPDGRQAENTVTFSGCREYGAESAVSYEGAPPAAPAASGDAAPPAMDIPAGLPVVIALTGRIDSAVAAAGDPFTGRLAKPVLDQLEHVLAPEGAIVHGRIASSVRSADGVTFHLTIETVEIGGREVPFVVTAQRPPAVPKPSTSGLKTRGVPIGEFPARPEEYVVTHAGPRWAIPDGFRTDWVTGWRR